MIERMKKGANTDCAELKIGSYKLLTADEKLLALQNETSHQNKSPAEAGLYVT